MLLVIAQASGMITLGLFRVASCRSPSELTKIGPISVDGHISPALSALSLGLIFSPSLLESLTPVTAILMFVRIGILGYLLLCKICE